VFLIEAMRLLLAKSGRWRTLPPSRAARDYAAEWDAGQSARVAALHEGYLYEAVER